MPIHLECLRGAQPGRRLAIRSDKPLTIRTQKSDQDAGEIQIELRDGLCVLANRSRMLCKVNGKERGEAVLAAGDEVVIGKQVFRLVVEDDDAESTQALQALAQAVAVPGERRFCSVCDALFDADDARRGWTDGARRICRSCMSKGVGPEHLPRPAVTPSADEPADLGGGDVSPLAVNQLDDQLQVEEPVTGSIASSSTTTALPPQLGEGDSSDAGRRSSRRISASRLAQVEPPAERGGLFKRVGAVFAGGREDRRRMETLAAERDDLLRDAGRASLKGNGGYGLSDAAMAVLMQGAALTVRRSDLAQGELERWRSLAARLDLIDAEIAALRHRLKLGLDPALARKPNLPPLRTDQRAHEERTFQVLDDLRTEDLDEFEDLVEEPSATPSPAAAPVAPKPVPQAVKSPTRPAPARDAARDTGSKAETASHPHTPPAAAKTAQPPAKSAAQRGGVRSGGDNGKSDSARRKLPRRRH